MHNRTPRYAGSEAPALSLADLAIHGENWIQDGQMRQLSARTIEARRSLVAKLLWFLRQQEAPHCGTTEVRAFLAYVATAHEHAGGRWGNAGNRKIASATKPVKPRTVRDYMTGVRTLFSYLIADGVLDTSPLDSLRPPVVREDQIQPFTREQVEALLVAAKRGRHAVRDEAMLLFLLDTGVRASEVCGLKIGEVDQRGHCCRVLGKGNKERTVYFGRKTSRALWTYLRTRRGGADPEQGLFLAENGQRPEEPLTRYGLLRRIETLGKAAGLEQARCSPHTFRHTFAIYFLRNGGDVFALSALLGHTSLTMTRRYLALAQADLEAQHRAASPADRLLRPKR